jgi:Glycosyl transferases group 1
MGVHFWEEPLFDSLPEPRLRLNIDESGVRILTPILPRTMQSGDVLTAQQRLLDRYMQERIRGRVAAWYYTPMALQFSGHLETHTTVYDCMDELSAFMGAPPELVDWEQKLFRRADVVFTGGASLYAAKRHRHPNVHLFPSSVDKQHFASARTPQADPSDQAAIPHPRIGFFGVLDERLDTGLLCNVAESHPEWHFVLIGPVVKIAEDQLPRAHNIHYLGRKDYIDLPRYIANWDVAMLPFAQNASTQFISPTKTPEYLAAGKRVVSTPIQDVVNPYGQLKMVEIAGNSEEFAQAIARLLDARQENWLANVDRLLSKMSWDITVDGMLNEIAKCRLRKTPDSLTPSASLQRTGTHV